MDSRIQLEPPRKCPMPHPLRAKGDKLEFLKWLERKRVFDPNVDGKQNSFRIPKSGEEN